MKKIISLLLAFTMVLMLCACDSLYESPQEQAQRKLDAATQYYNNAVRAYNESVQSYNEMQRDLNDYFETQRALDNYRSR